MDTNLCPSIYEPLPGSNHIRLLHLEPGTGNIQFTLRPVSLDDKPEYEAVSYCWGDVSDTRPVYCGTISLEITNSLHTALRRLRYEKEIRVLWADAICINQHNVAEKNTQVQLMRRIYSQPSRVLIWLGDDMTGLEGLADCLAGADSLLPPETFDRKVLYENSREIFVEAWVSSR